MKIIPIILSLALFVSCKKEDSKSDQNNSSKDSLAVKNEPVSVQNDSIKTIEDIKKEYANLNALLTSKKLEIQQSLITTVIKQKEKAKLFSIIRIKNLKL